MVPIACQVSGLSPPVRGEPFRSRSFSASAWVYPRPCGGTPPGRSISPAHWGLSPPVRGEPLPVCATGIVQKVYPRPCGGTTSSVLNPLSPGGLSPPHSFQLSACAGSIPARAGEPPDSPGATPPPWVYPRPCGGTSSTDTVNLACKGLSPPVRGNPEKPRQTETLSRSIPARAGEPPPDGCPRIIKGVYPRPCGGTATSESQATKHPGLSPPVRGNHIKAALNFDLQGSIPARAGEP